MSEDHSRYGIQELDPFGRHLAEAADKHWFTYQPWDTFDTRHELSDQQLVDRVRLEIESNGYWSAYGEMAMGAGMVARIDLATVNGEAVFRATGGRLMKISATYRTLDRALDMAAMFAKLGWEMVEATSWRDSEWVDLD
jgi:hypothetical protein